MSQKLVVAIIPARGGSKGIPRKNARFMAQKPLIGYAIENARQAKRIDKVVVSTDDEELAHIAEHYHCEVIMRPPELALDDVPLDPVIHHALQEVEKRAGHPFDFVVTIQPTSPLLSSETMDRAIERLHSGGADTLISVVDDRHLSWTIRDGKHVPAYTERKNRQLLPPCFRETGGIVVTKRAYVSRTSRFGPLIDVIVLDEKEAIDIDTQIDWWIAEKLLTRKRILFRTDGHNEIGLGHVYRTLLLADRLIDHDLLFVTRKAHRLGAEIIENRHYPLATFDTDEAFDTIIDGWRPHMVINDILDTDEDYIRSLKGRHIFTVNFEDLGKGAVMADLVINALYEEPLPMDNYHCGESYYCLREEFFLVGQKVVKPEVRNILLTFGGTDSGDYTQRVLGIIESMSLEGVSVTIIAGRGYAHTESLERFIEDLKTPVDFVRDIKTISRFMETADIIFTSAGRTVYEIASIGTPVFVIAQNNRELRHTFARAENGIINLGLGSAVTDDDIRTNLRRLIDNVDIRKRCNALMRAHDLRSGVDRTLTLIFSELAKFEKEPHE